LLSAITTPLFTTYDKFRILGEPFRKPGTNPDETVADMVIRRMGRSFLDYAVDPFISGVYAGDPHRLVTRFALPKLYALENNYGSFVKGSMKKRKDPKTALEKRVTREVFSAKGGLQHLIQALYEGIGEQHVLTDCNGVKVYKDDNGYVCSFTDSESSNIQLRSKYVITTVPGNCLPGLFSFIEDKYLQPITDLNYAKVVQVAVGYKTWTGKTLNAFGGLVPSLEKRKCLGILFPSSLFENRAPDGGTLLSVFLGGIKKPEIITKSDAEITQMVLDEVKETLQCVQKPDLIRIFRYENAIPQYEISSGRRSEAIDDIQNRYPGLILAGNIRNGIGMSDRVKQAIQIANEIIGCTL
jgi:oxygen-dependent protoporphyrinogen oxidase